MFREMWVTYIFLLILCSTHTESNKISGPSGSKAIAQLRKDLLRDYDPYTRPCLSTADNTTVTVGLELTAIKRLDEREALFHFDAFLKMTWFDLSLRWDPASYDGIEILNLQAHEIWKPDIAVYNGPGHEAFPIKAMVQTLVYPSGYVMWVPPVSISSMCGNFDYRQYPKDKQICQVTLGSWTTSGLKLDLKPEYPKDNNDSFLADNNPTWKYESMTIERKVKYYACCPNEPYPTVIFNFTIARRGSEGVASTTTARNTLLVLVLAMFWIPATNGGRKLIPGILALIGHIGLLIQSSLLVPNLTLIPYALLPLNLSIIFTSAAILIELLVLSVINLSGDCPPLATLGSMLSTKSIKLLMVNACQPGGDGLNHGPFSTESKTVGVFKNWPLVATLIDRVSFLIFTILFFIICAIW